MSLISYDRDNATLRFCCNGLIKACFTAKLDILGLTRMDSEPLLTLGDKVIRICPFCGTAEAGEE
jgi:hypothetical protein